MLLLFLKHCTNSLYCITKCLNDDEIYQTRKVVQAENFHKKKEKNSLCLYLYTGLALGGVGLNCSL